MKYMLLLKKVRISGVRRREKALKMILSVLCVIAAVPDTGFAYSDHNPVEMKFIPE